MRTYKRGRQWYVHLDDGTRRSLYTTDEVQARRNLSDFLTEQREAQKPRMSVGDLFPLYMESVRGRRSFPRVRLSWSLLKPMFGTMLPRQITEAVCRDYMASRKGAAPGTIRQELKTLRTALHWGAKRELSERGYLIDMPSEPPPRDRRLTREQAAALIAAADYPHVRLFIILALTTAARGGALCDLTWDRVDWERRILHLSTGAAHQKRRATPPINNTLAAALSEAQAAAVTPYVIEWAGQRLRKMSHAFAVTAKRAGLPWVTPHVLRHTAATWMVEAGVPLEAVAQYLGHSSTAICYRVYSRYSPTFQREAASALELPTMSAIRRKKA